MNDEEKKQKMLEYVKELFALKVKYGLKPTEIRVNPNDEFLTKFGTICGLKVVHDYNVQPGNLILL